MKNFIHKPILVLAICAQQQLFAQVPVLNSCPAAAPTVYLEFKGDSVSATAWNYSGEIKAEPAGLDAHSIREIFSRISQDFRPFLLNITTDPVRYKKAPAFQRIKIIFTPVPAGFANASGESFVGSFSWGDNTPAWVFTDLLGNNPSYIATAASHEIGHTLGLQHQCIYDEAGRKLTEYHSGAGNGCMRWSPIMGVALYSNLRSWYQGRSSKSAGSAQNDLDIITSAPNYIAFRKDDYANSCTNAYLIPVYDHAFSLMGVINEPKDTDVFEIEIDSAQRMQLKMISYASNKKIKLELLNERQEFIATYTAREGDAIIVDRFMLPGKYYIRVQQENTSSPFQTCLYALIGGFESPASYHRTVLTNAPSGHALAFVH